MKGLRLVFWPPPDDKTGMSRSPSSFTLGFWLNALAAVLLSAVPVSAQELEGAALLPRPQIDLGLDLMGEGRVFRGSIEDYRKALQDDPKNYRARFGLGRLYQQMGLFEKAIAEYRKTLEVEPLFPAAWHGIGGSYLSLQKYPESGSN